MKLAKGTQVIYQPSHITDRWFDYPNGCQPGFVMSSPHDGDYFVRYWLLEDGRVKNELRTKANSELTPDGCLSVLDTVPQSWVDQAIAAIEYGEFDQRRPFSTGVKT